MSGLEKWIRWGFVGLIVVILGTLVTLRGRRTPVHINHPLKELSHAKQIYFAVTMYEADHGGVPLDHQAGGAFSNSNQVFRYLVPAYIKREAIFYSVKSPWTPRPPDEKTGDGKTLAAGENCFAYVTNVRSHLNLNLPLIASGFGKGTPGTYPWDKEKRRRLPSGRAAVIRNDGSGRIERIEDDGRLYGSDNIGNKIDLFKPASGWLSTDQALLNPE